MLQADKYQDLGSEVLTILVYQPAGPFGDTCIAYFSTKVIRPEMTAFGTQCAYEDDNNGLKDHLLLSIMLA